jgi:hypothetical protein
MTLDHKNHEMFNMISVEPLEYLGSVATHGQLTSFHKKQIKWTFQEDLIRHLWTSLPGALNAHILNSKAKR